MKRNLLLFILLLITTYFSSCSESVDAKKEAVIKEKRTYKQVPIAGNAYLRFYQFNDSLTLYFEPQLIINSQKFPIKGLDSIYGNIGEIKAVSPDGNYFILDLISINQPKNKSVCAVIDVQNKAVVRVLNDACNGEWNTANQWLVNGNIVVSFD